ncbi:type I 3-dehydroquinate dehydratase [Weissella ceti]|uniref:3-dehydroquinate dehydratase n=1 Tax=Weissella ceti TaxID=759620 RepID=A0ABT3E5Z5_9LACO|nr:type I 3-dehydroquinate dehydratase [Weissella ceti]MCW0953843.1 type I 3-dehydroquinate dehydratase [Weissella ceti]QVK11660.1 type I 3-dehydroquinate dehydratase [Weissella ceti]
MSSQLQIGKLVRQQERPLIAIAMQVKDASETKGYLQAGIDERVDVLEWRIDAWQDLRTLTVAVIKEVMVVSQRPIIFTWRTREEGGLKNYNAHDYQAVYYAAIEAGIAAIDIETNVLDDQMTTRAFAKAQGVTVIGSRHDWQYPSNLHQRLFELADMPVDVIKYAVMAENEDQANMLLAETKALFQQCEMPLITMAMGDAGSRTRLEGFRHGSQLTFAQAGQASAPGQLSVDDIAKFFADSYLNDY